MYMQLCKAAMTSNTHLKACFFHCFLNMSRRFATPSAISPSPQKWKRKTIGRENISNNTLCGFAYSLLGCAVELRISTNFNVV